MNIKYLVRNLTLICEGKVTKHSLSYVDIDENGVRLSPFDRERAGYEYRENLVLTEKDGKLIAKALGNY